MPTDDEFMEIIENSNLSDMTEENLNRMTVKDLHIGLKDLSHSLVIITEFVHDYFSSFEEEGSAQPALTTTVVTYAKDMFVAARKFCEEFYDNEYDEEEDDDDEEDYDDDGEDDE